jgi:hypothetical protein
MRAFRPAPQELYHEYLYFVGWASCPSLMISGLFGLSLGKIGVVPCWDHFEAEMASWVLISVI